MRKIKEWISAARGQKRVHSDDLDRIIRRCKQKYGYLFPRYTCTKNGSKSVHHFNAPNVYPISLERVHGSREYVPSRYKDLILDGLDGLVSYIESNTRDEENESTDHEDETND